MLELTLVLALFVGIAVGTLGSGGSVLSVPLLAYVAGMDPKQAIAVAHLVVAVTSGVTAISFVRAGRVQWRTGVLLGGTGFVGAYGGGLLARFVSGTILLIGFASIVILTGVAMLRGLNVVADEDDRKPLPLVVVIIGGFAIGLVSGLVGAGGSVFVVPFLTLVGGLSMAYSVGTSLIVGSLNSFAGLGGYLAHVHLDMKMAAVFTVVTVVGGQVGVHVHTRVDPDALRRAFGLLALAISSIIFGREINAAAGITVAALTALVAAIAFARAGLKRRASLGRDISEAPTSRKAGKLTGSRSAGTRGQRAHHFSWPL